VSTAVVGAEDDYKRRYTVYRRLQELGKYDLKPGAFVVGTRTSRQPQSLETSLCSRHLGWGLTDCAIGHANLATQTGCTDQSPTSLADITTNQYSDQSPTDPTRTPTSTLMVPDVAADNPD
jgi:hypothetical protein